MQTKHVEITKKQRAIVQFGPPTAHSGMRPAEYYQVTIDPNMVSPGGRFIRFDQNIQQGEMHGWQRVDCITICEILGNAPEYDGKVPGYEAKPDAMVTMLQADYEQE